VRAHACHRAVAATNYRTRLSDDANAGGGGGDNDGTDDDNYDDDDGGDDGDDDDDDGTDDDGEGTDVDVGLLAAARAQSSMRCRAGCKSCRSWSRGRPPPMWVAPAVICPATHEG
jgi:hypothetical protein